MFEAVKTAKAAKTPANRRLHMIAAANSSTSRSANQMMYLKGEQGIYETNSNEPQ
jgi:hypothetical protein